MYKWKQNDEWPNQHQDNKRDRAGEGTAGSVRAWDMCCTSQVLWYAFFFLIFSILSIFLHLDYQNLMNGHHHYRTPSPEQRQAQDADTSWVPVSYFFFFLFYSLILHLDYYSYYNEAREGTHGSKDLRQRQKKLETVWHISSPGKSFFYFFFYFTNKYYFT